MSYIDHPLVKKIINSYLDIDEYEEHRNYAFDDAGNSEFMLSWFEHLDSLADIPVNHCFTGVFEELAIYHAQVCNYALLNDNSQEAGKHFEISEAYGAFTIEATAQCSQQGMQPNSLWMKNIGVFWANTMISGRWESADRFAHYAIESINATGCLFGSGHPEHLSAWFLVDLHCKAATTSYDQLKAYLPEEDDYKIYQNAIDNWDTSDLKQLDLIINELLELHIIQVHLSFDDEEDFCEFMDVDQLLSPYHVLAWLALRKKHNLVLPDTYTHPLMNSNFATVFLATDATTPSKRKVLPYMQDISARLKEQCPEIELM